jgi:hypothetical protein
MPLAFSRDIHQTQYSEDGQYDKGTHGGRITTGVLFDLRDDVDHQSPPDQIGYRVDSRYAGGHRPLRQNLTGHCPEWPLE